MKLFKNTLIAAAVLSASSLSFAANTVGNVSNGNSDKVKYVKVGDTVNKKHPEYNGKAGINIVYTAVKSEGDKTGNNHYQSFEKMSSMLSNSFKKWVLKSVLQKTDDGVYVARMYNMSKIFSYVPGMPEHRDLGRMSFKQVGNMDVWFGDWEDVPRNSKHPIAEASKYTVYYAGTGQTATNDLPGGKVTYTIKGINNHHNVDTPILTGDLTANFGNKKVVGNLARAGLDIRIKGKIEGAGFSGKATANRTIHGQSEGKFYGAQAAGVAGMATFASDHSKDTAFGGMKK